VLDNKLRTGKHNRKENSQSLPERREDIQCIKLFDIRSYIIRKYRKNINKMYLKYCHNNVIDNIIKYTGSVNKHMICLSIHNKYQSFMYNMG